MASSRGSDSGPLCIAAQLFDATGWVLNDSEGVLIEIQATQDNITRFLDELILSPPPMAKIISVQEVQREKKRSAV